MKLYIMKTFCRDHKTARNSLFLAFCIITMAWFLCACASQEPTKDQAPPYESPYSWENLILENGRPQYYENGEQQSLFGIDVSEHQKYIEWQAVADDGVMFAIIRIGNRGATEGALYLDEYYETNMTGAQQAGIATGVYFFSQALNEEEALEEAQFVLAHLEGWDLDYPVAFDHEPVSGLEGRANNLTGEQVSRCAEVFCETIEEAGYETMIYGNRADLLKLDAWILNRYPLWLAEYDVSHPTLEHDFAIWQYTSSGSVAGIDTQTDLNIHFLALDES